MALVTKFKLQGSERVGNGVVATGESVSRGTIAMINSDGYVEEIDDETGAVFAGIVKASADAGENCELDYGSPFFYGNGSAARSDVGELAYVSGAGAVAKTSNHSVYVGAIVDVEISSGWWIDPAVAFVTEIKNYALATTGTTGGSDAGEVAVVGLTATAVVLATLAEDAGANLVLADVVCATDKFTVYTRDTSTGTRAALEGKKVNYAVLSM